MPEVSPIRKPETMPKTLWIITVIAVIAMLCLALIVLRRSRQAGPPGGDLPTKWTLLQRPIFSPEERALYRQLRTALPNHTVLAKLPLVRFCQPQNRDELDYWFNLLGPLHVSFVICTDNGRVIAAVDIERPSRPSSQRAITIKQSVLEACHVRYLKCRSDQLPSTAELHRLVPHTPEAIRPMVPGHLRDSQEQRSTLAHTLRAKSTGPQSRWYESGFSQDSFFAPDLQREPFVDNSPATGGADQPPAQGPDTWTGSRNPIRRSEDFGPSGDAAGHIIGRV
jgi:Protein of unknown function (DUF2726)